MSSNSYDVKGLSQKEVLTSRKSHGDNIIVVKKENHFWKSIFNFFKNPMVLLSLIAFIIYLISGKTADAIFFASVIVLISGISSYQNARSRNALSKLKDFTKFNCKVIRNAETVEIKTEAKLRIICQ